MEASVEIARWLAGWSSILEKRMGVPLCTKDSRGERRPGYPELVVIFCGGKCGSSSLRALFQDMGVPTVRIHNVDHFVDEYAPFLKQYPEVRKKLHLDVILTLLHHVYRDILVLDAYRDPVERKLSSFFQNFHVNLARASIDETVWQGQTFDAQVRCFESRILPLLENRDGIDSMSPAFFQGEFDFARRFQKMAHPTLHSVTFLKLRFRDIARWPRIISDALGLSDLPTHQTPCENMSATKPYVTQYRQWQQGFRVQDMATLCAMVLHPVFLKYHTLEETTAYVEQWWPRSK